MPFHYRFHACATNSTCLDVLSENVTETRKPSSAFAFKLCWFDLHSCHILLTILYDLLTFHFPTQYVIVQSLPSVTIISLSVTDNPTCPYLSLRVY